MKRCDISTILSLWVLTMLIVAGCAEVERTSLGAGHYVNQGVTYHKKGQYDQAIFDYDKALEINPRLAIVYNNRGLAYAEGKGDYARAIADYDKALEINPTYAHAYYNRSVAYFSEREYERAWDDVHKAQDLGFQVPPGFLRLLSETSGRQS